VESTLSWVIAIGVIVLLIIQGGVFVGLYFLARRLVVIVERTSHLQTKAEYMISNAEPVLKMAHSLMAELKEAASYVAQGMQHVNAITEMARDEAAEVKNILSDTTAIARREIERTRQQFEKVQNTLSLATDKFDRTTTIVHQSVLQPAREFSYLMYGLRRAIEVLMTGKRLPVDRAYQDEEMFI
jgi:hypothetical protein